MNKEEFLKELDNRLTNISVDIKEDELRKIDEYIENGKLKNIKEEEIIKSLGAMEDIVKTIYIKRGININDEKSIKGNIVAIARGIKKVFLSKDTKLISASVGKILYTLFIAIIIKIPFIFLKTLLLDSLNANNVSYNIQNFISLGFDFVHVIVALVVIYKYLKKYFANK